MLTNVERLDYRCVREEKGLTSDVIPSGYSESKKVNP